MLNKVVRPSWEEYFFNIAREVARRATCDRAHVGCIIVTPDNRIIGTGYNGAPPGEPHCDDVGHFFRDGHCVRTTHAERNAIEFTWDGKSNLEGCRIFGYISAGATVNTACTDCQSLADFVGIERIFWKND